MNNVHRAIIEKICLKYVRHITELDFVYPVPKKSLASFIRQDSSDFGWSFKR